jgi:hypothetical protein
VRRAVTSLLPVLLPGLLLLLLVLPATLLAQPPATGRLQGTVRGTASGSEALVPLSYAVVSLPQRADERFTDGGGRFLWTDLPAGEHAVLVRRLGYAPWRGTVTIVAGETTPLEVTLERIPVRLDEVRVQAAARCDRPGLPDARTNPAVAMLAALLRENADRYRLLASAYPFEYEHLRAVGTIVERAPPESALRFESVERVRDRSVSVSRYRPGEVVTPQPPPRPAGEFLMSLPTILDLSDDAFARAHCFAYGGRESVGTETWLRLDVRAADRLRTPDVHGRFWLDSATAELRRMEIELSHVERLPPALRRVAALRVQTVFTEIAPGLSILRDICALTLVAPRRRGDPPRLESVELQQLSRYAFTTAPPGVQASRTLRTTTWPVRAPQPRSLLWCER